MSINESEHIRDIKIKNHQEINGFTKVVYSKARERQERIDEENKFIEKYLKEKKEEENNG